MRALATALLAAGLLAAAMTAPAASAATYTVDICKGEGSVSGGAVFGEIAGTAGIVNVDSCGGPPQIAKGIEQKAVAQTAKGLITWRINAPQGTTIQKVEGSRGSSGNWPTPELIWEVVNAAGTRFDLVNGTTMSAQVTYEVKSASIIVGFRCRVEPCNLGAQRPFVRLGSVVATIDDPVLPVADIDQLPAGTDPVRGTIPISFTARDEGAGVRSYALFVDGVNVASGDDANEGRCAAPFHFLTPCKTTLDASLPLDTTALANGEHSVLVAVEDGAGQINTSTPVTVRTDNTAPGGGGPGGGAPPNGGPGGSGTPGGGAAAMRPPRPTPLLTALALAPKSPKAGKRAKLAFTGSEAGTLAVTIAPVGAGAARRKVAKPLATVTAAVVAGTGSVPLRTRAKGKALKPGAYLLTATLRTADGRVSAPATLRFKVLSGTSSATRRSRSSSACLRCMPPM